MSEESGNTQAIAKRDLPEAVTKRGINEGQWNTLCRSLYPGANPNSVLLVWDYCKARELDPMKKPCHIVPMEVRDAKTGNYEWRDVVMPGIYEYRTTAHRTGEYLGHTPAVYGPEKESYGVVAPEWCEMTVFRWNDKAKKEVAFPVQVFFSEVVATKKDRQSGEFRANARWSRAPKQMLTKCAEAAAIREAFPEEIGGEPTAEEMDGQRTIHTADVVEAEVEPHNPLAKVSEGLAVNIGKAFQMLGMTEAQQLIKVNEFVKPEDPEGGAEALLGILEEMVAQRKKGQKPAQSTGDNRKAKPASQPEKKVEKPEPQVEVTEPVEAEVVPDAPAQAAEDILF